ncbi:hypothetical protein MLD38_015165 [Melastoma candidum]|uniref:Uncharacterized protein n=1 Tax=Melastoma candidum TaxID=119954 RepID=A0ACB9RF88_9MYRT|nr:hypothetical protein MLD38_015165 [Melastoma candidum]
MLKLPASAGVDRYAGRMKRKGIDLDLDLDLVPDHDFSLSSPAPKIRRLDAELPTIAEDEEFECSSPVMERMEAEDDLATEAPAENGERAIVVFRPVEEYLLRLRSPSSFSVSFDSELISGFKSQFPWSNGSSVDGAAKDDGDSSNVKCMAVVPWVPSQFPSAPGAEIIDSEDMETEGGGGGEVEMEVEVGNLHPNVVGDFVGGLQTWQQHCMTTQLPQLTSAPAAWQL